MFAGVSFALRAGDALLLRGPNGSGKSSLLRILAGFLKPAAGELSWDGGPIQDDPAAQRVRAHYVGHADGIKPALTVRESLAFAAAIGGGHPDRLPAALAGFGLAAVADMPCRLLSAGQRRRTTLARLLASPRPLWLLDEPGVGLDAASRARLQAAIAEHRCGGGVAVVASHGEVEIAGAAVLRLGAA